MLRCTDRHPCKSGCVYVSVRHGLPPGAIGAASRWANWLRGVRTRRLRVSLVGGAHPVFFLKLLLPLTLFSAGPKGKIWALPWTMFTTTADGNENRIGKAFDPSTKRSDCYTSR